MCAKSDVTSTTLMIEMDELYRHLVTPFLKTVWALTRHTSNHPPLSRLHPESRPTACGASGLTRREPSRMQWGEKFLVRVYVCP